MQKALDKQDLAKPYLDRYDLHTNQADMWWNKAKDALHKACKAAGFKIHTTEEGMADMADICAFGVIGPDGKRITEFALGNHRKRWCVDPGEWVDWNSPQCKQHHDVFAWLPRIKENVSEMELQSNYSESYMNNYGHDSGIANDNYNLAKPYLNSAAYWEKQADKYTNGMNTYGAMVSTHNNIAKGFENRYNGYLTHLQRYAGKWECVDENEHNAQNQTSPHHRPLQLGEQIDPEFQERVTDEDWGGDLVLDHKHQKLYRLNTPKQEHCDAGELWVLTEDGEIQTKQKAFDEANVGQKRDYHQYMYARLIEPYNEVMEAANAYYKGTLATDTDHYALLLEVTGRDTLYTDGIETLEDTITDDGNTYWQAQAYNSDGQILKAKLGNGIENSWEYDKRGRSTYIKAQKNNTALQQLNLVYDAIGNLKQRQDSVQNITEDFIYDPLNRLKKSTLSGNGASAYDQAGLLEQTFKYNALGNLIYKSGVGDYKYGQNGAGLHAVTQTTNGMQAKVNYQYDANGNQISDGHRTVTYTQYNKPKKIVKGANQNQFEYGPERQMIWQKAVANNTTQETRYPAANFEQQVTLGSSIHDIHHLKMGKHTIAVFKTNATTNTNTVNQAQPGTEVSTHYLHQDHLDSIVMVTNKAGEVIERHHYDAFGQQRTGVLSNNQQAKIVSGLAIQNAFSAITDRGFTNHRQLNGVGLIHMGGRVYDPNLGRFLSADPHIQSPLNSQSVNRYSYVLNNPLSLNDPTGYFFSFLKKLFKKIAKIIKRIIKVIVNVIKRVIRYIAKQVRRFFRWVKRNIKTIIMVALQFIPVIGQYASYIIATYQAAYTLKNGGSLTDVLKSAAVAWVVNQAGNIGDFGKTLSGYAVKVGTGIANFVAKSGSVLHGIIGASINGGLVNGFTSGLTAKILGGSFSKSFKNSFVVTAAATSVAGYVAWRKAVSESATQVAEGEHATPGGRDPNIHNASGGKDNPTMAPADPDHVPHLERMHQLAKDAATEVDASFDTIDTYCKGSCKWLPWLKPMLRGTAIHTLFAAKLRALDASYSAEISYKDGDLVRYGTSGSIRADGVFGNISRPDFVVELKTGRFNYMSRGEAKRYLENLPNGTPVYPLYVD